mmetsp:Transcript_29157/g.74391  ORF Transcript_29157/g.74391 Transcript_29157/m.74391 type:complete len:207 (+) Transcript_29157:1390-2010(+)|eukprot:CAMPEP_0202866156 /NCGR_PEP_ID=MMETSP1391-20130828/7226_1 /ASSEMBLY_ACC=CAM_ASM_000867 /TAXON_ID=1034604 /ORGANISM="Chlamydomonas leiostraca, Strain SAG 11-49" /LENGTH=206 /DNA_ID=CAMNT_0049546079 /DNA_START=1340 /DNA_END=1960 /DNA_ORIENTATION=-
MGVVARASAWRPRPGRYVGAVTVVAAWRCRGCCSRRPVWRLPGPWRWLRGEEGGEGAEGQRHRQQERHRHHAQDDDAGAVKHARYEQQQDPEHGQYGPKNVDQHRARVNCVPEIPVRRWLLLHHSSGGIHIVHCGLRLWLHVCDDDMQHLGGGTADKVSSIELFARANDADKLVGRQLPHNLDLLHHLRKCCVGPSWNVHCEFRAI